MVSVVIPVYNSEKYLRECMESIVNQTLREIEILCVNDGSTDGSLAILEAYSAVDPRITIISQDNRGVSSARNHGIRCAQGDYVYFIDSDDTLDTTALEKAADLAVKNRLDVLVFAYDRVYECEELRQAFPDPPHNIGESPEVGAGVEYLKAMNDLKLYTPVVWRAVFRTAFLREQGISFEEGFIHEDYLFSFLAYMNAERVLWIPDKLYHRRIREASIITTAKSSKNAIGLFSAGEGFLKYAFQDTYAEDKEHELFRAYKDMSRRIARTYNELSAEEQAKVVFPREIENELFRQITAAYQAGLLRKELGKEREGKKNALKESAQWQKKADSLQRELEKEKKNAVKESAQWQKKADNLQRELEKEKKNAVKESVRWQKKTEKLQHELDRVHGSASYRIGRAVTWLPRKLRGFLRRLQRHTTKK